MMATFRPLQPAPMDQDQPPQSHNKPVLTQKPKRTVTLGACVACRKRKSKCDGTRPTCSCCAQKETECIYELGPNEKPSQAMKRKNEEMQGELLNLRQLYDFLRLRPEQEALEILRRIRADPPDTTPSQRIQELADLVRNGDDLIQSFATPTGYRSDPIILPPLRLALDPSSAAQNPFSSGPQFPNSILLMESKSPASQRRRYASETDVSARSDTLGSVPPTSIEAILQETVDTGMHDPTDSRLGSARNWTSVIDDVDSIVHLMSAWHRWEYKYYHFLDWEIFLQDMTSGRTNFCSKLLVNAILTSASFQFAIAQDRSRPSLDNITTLFYNEARRLWEQDEGQDSLTRLQAAMILYLVLGKFGRDKEGHSFLVEACHMAYDLGLFDAAGHIAVQNPHDVPEQKWKQMRSVTAWAFFRFQLVMSFTYSFDAIMKSPPSLSIPYDDTPDFEALFRSECARQVIMADCSKTLWGAESMACHFILKPEQLEVLYLRLKTWWDSRPPTLDPIKNPLPENLLTAMIYHASNIQLVQSFIGRDSSAERIKTFHPLALSITSTSLKELRRLLTLHEVRHGWSNTITYVLHPIMITSWGSLEEIARDDTIRPLEASEPYQGLLTCLRALSALSRFIFYAQALFRILTQSCQALGIHLPSEIASTLDYYKSDQWTKNAASIVSSQYVADMRKSSSDLEDGRMDTVIAQWDALTLGDASKDSRSTQENEDSKRLHGT